MIKLYEHGAYLLNGTEIIEDVNDDRQLLQQRQDSRSQKKKLQKTQLRTAF